MPATKLKKEAPISRILNAALATIAENTISGTRMRQIASTADMSQGNLHYYFPSKDGLFQSLLEDILSSFIEERQSELDNQALTPSEKIRCFLSQMQSILEDRRPTMEDA